MTTFGELEIIPDPEQHCQAYSNTENISMEIANSKAAARGSGGGDPCGPARGGADYGERAKRENSSDISTLIMAIIMIITQIIITVQNNWDSNSNDCNKRKNMVMIVLSVIIATVKIK